ncbi:coiled-coil domain-containing protein 43-like [Teleopsis dalmanni]|uniref:coiled-coil domain-containing protein 43-like n=1 Tax=Teleopsis dalmanni TaxID=139649 RepID=UPI0018CFB678|nr:coiled-coil domain-containing protein 43-like [Teleopsis dalmanni]
MTDNHAIFKKWLLERLREWQTDESIFGNYILGVLESDETHEEKTDALQDLLGAVVGDTSGLVEMIFEKWKELMPQKEETAKAAPIDVNEQLAKLLEAQKIQPVNKERQYTEEERRIREQILAQYSETAVSDEDYADEPEETAEKTTANSLTGIERNTNVHDVIQLQKERREQARLDSAAKKQKDREDREKQKQQREEKKEKRKTVKGERRR